MSKHTPGPWIYVRSERKIGVRDNSDTQSFGMVSAIAYIDEYDHEEFLHNASLIAAAPELLEALEALLTRDRNNTCLHSSTHRGGAIWEICDYCGEKWSDDRAPKPEWSDPEEWGAARAAITKAKGEQQ